MKMKVLGLAVALGGLVGGAAGAAASIIDIFAGYHGDSTLMRVVNNSGLAFSGVTIKAVADAFAGESEALGALGPHATLNAPFANSGGAFAFDYDDSNGSLDTTYQLIAVSGATTYMSPIFSPLSNATGGTVEFLGNEIRSGEPDFEPMLVASVTAAPEPSTWAMMGLGFASLGLASYGRARKLKAQVV